MNLFDHLENIHSNKVSWDSLSDVDKKTWTTYMVNRYISMLGMVECQLVSTIQKYPLENSIVYDFYKAVFPKQKRFGKYIKNLKETKHNPELIKILSGYYEMSQREIIESFDIISIEEKTEILTGYGYNVKEIKQLLK